MSKNTGSRPLRWLHLSDLHFKEKEKWDRRETLTALIQKVKELKEEGYGPDLVFLTGDIAYSGKKTEYDQALGFLEKLQAATSLEPARQFFLIPGNHDVDQKKVTDPEGRLLLVKDRPGIEELLSDPRMMNLLGRRLGAFYDFANLVQGSARDWSPERPWRVDLPEVATELGSIAVLQLNSAWASGSNDEKHLLVGKMQVQEALLEAKGADLKIALVHHPISELYDVDREDLETLIPSSVQLLLLGHLHRERTSLIETPSGTFAQLATGAVYNEDTYARKFLLGELAPRGQLKIHYFSYSGSEGGFWAPDSHASRRAPKGIWVTRLKLPKAKIGEPPSVHALYRQAVQAVHGIARLIGMGDTQPFTNARVQDLFVPVRFEVRGVAKGSWTMPQLLSFLLKPQRKVRPASFLLGAPGSGKTTVLRFAAVWLAGGVNVEGIAMPEKGLLPLFLPLREYLEVCSQSECSMLDFLKRQAVEHLRVNLPEGFLEEAIERNEAVLLLDGLDEVGDAGARNQVLAQLLAFCDRNPRLPVLITSRILGYEELPLPRESERGFRHFYLAEFSDDDIALFTHNWYRVQEPVNSVARAEGIKELSTTFNDSRLRELAKNPRIATLLALVHRLETHLPGQRAKLYELCLKTLLETLPGRSNQRFEEIDDGLQRAYLEDLALRMQETRDQASSEVVIAKESLVLYLFQLLRDRITGDLANLRLRIERWITHLQRSTGLLVEQRPANYAFFDRSFVEYLAGCALDRRSETCLERVVEVSDQPHWREVCLQIASRRATDSEFLDKLFDRLAEKESWDFLLLSLREDAAFHDDQKIRILREVGRQLLDKSVHSWRECHQGLDLVGHSIRHREWSRGWIEEEVRTARKEALQGIVALRFNAESELIVQLSERLDAQDAAGDLLDFWPGSRVGQWASTSAAFSVAFHWGRTAPIELSAARSVAGCTSSSALAAGLLSGRLRYFSAIGERSADRLARLPPPSGFVSLPRSHQPDLVVGATPRFSGDFAQHFTREFSWDFSKDFTSCVISHPFMGGLGSPLEGADPDLAMKRRPDEEVEQSKSLLLTRQVPSWATMAASGDNGQESKNRDRQARVQNAWLLEIWSAIDQSMSGRDLLASNFGLYFALGWTQALTTGRWPGTKRWKHLLASAPPTHWLPRMQWHLCWLLPQQTSAEHCSAISAAIEEGWNDEELPGVAAALVEDLGWRRQNKTSTRRLGKGRRRH